MAVDLSVLVDEDYDEEEKETKPIEDNLWMLNYVLEVEASLRYPELERSCAKKYRYCYPLFEFSQGGHPSFPDLNGFFEILGGNKEERSIKISLKLEQEETTELHIDQTEEFEIDYVGSAHVKGHVGFTLRYMDVDEQSSIKDGYIFIKRIVKDIDDGEIYDEGEDIIDLSKYRDGDNTSIAILDRVYNLIMFDSKKRYYILYCLATNRDNRDVDDECYIPLYEDEPNVELERLPNFIDDEDVPPFMTETRIVIEYKE